MKPTGWLVAIQCALAPALVAWSAAAAPPSWQETVQADWLRQDAKRLGTTSAGRVPRE